MPLTAEERHWGISFLTFVILATATMTFINMQKSVGSQALSSSPTKYTASYYGGNYDISLGWVIDNNDQCYKIKNNQTSEKSLEAVLSSNLKKISGNNITYTCDRPADDPGVGYFNDIPLHNSVSFAELSNNPSSKNPDYSAMGNLPARSRVEIAYNGKCVVAEKLDVGTGGYGQNGYPRAIDLWWQTARSLGFKEGLDTVSVRLMSKSTPLTAINKSYDCATGKIIESQSTASYNGSVAGNAAATVIANEKSAKQKAKSKKAAKQKKSASTNKQARAGQVLAAATTVGPTPINRVDNGMNNSLWLASIVAITGAAVAFLYMFHWQRAKHLDLLAEAKKIIHT